MPETRDPFLQQFFSRISPTAAASFSDGQLDAIKQAFGARTPGAHAVDLRLSLPIGRRRFYLVLLAGRERRGRARIAVDRPARPLWTVANAVVLILFALMLAASGAVALYSFKRALGLDLLPGIDGLPDRTIEQWLR